MNKVFEDIVGIGLRDALTGSGSTVELQRPIKLGAESSFGATPDIVIRQGQQVVAVADVKYINSQKGISTSELYQAVTYATHFRLDSCTLIYPQPQRVRHVRIGDVTVFIDHLDLALPAAQRREVLKGMAHAPDRPLNRPVRIGCRGCRLAVRLDGAARLGRRRVVRQWSARVPGAGVSDEIRRNDGNPVARVRYATPVRAEERYVDWFNHRHLHGGIVNDGTRH